MTIRWRLIVRIAAFFYCFYVSWPWTLLERVDTAIEAQFTPLTDHRVGVVLEGHWQSCLVDGEYEERVYDHPSPPAFELHLGPKDDFALFRGAQDEHRDHDSATNLLAGHHYDALPTLTGGRTWHALGLRFNAIRAGGSRDECESFVLLLERLPAPPTSVR